ncbi:hypothetical protein, partial [Bordetella pertussis]|uniref:hypothetical protein n=1 Tax=Bordetella pertussis TaxID=520 RepID=UPI001C9E78F1
LLARDGRRAAMAGLCAGFDVLGRGRRIARLGQFGLDLRTGGGVAGPQRLLPILSGEPTRTERH